MTTRPVTTWDVLDGHVTLDLQCLDRIYLNGYVPNLQVGGQIVQFLAGQTPLELWCQAAAVCWRCDQAVAWS